MVGKDVGESILFRRTNRYQKTSRNQRRIFLSAGMEVIGSPASVGKKLKNNQVGPLILAERIQNSSVVNTGVTESIRSPWRLDQEQHGGFLRNLMAESAQ